MSPKKYYLKYYLKKKTKYETFIALFTYWRKRYKLPDVPIIEDRRYKDELFIETSLGCSTRAARVVYNKYKISKWTYAEIVCAALHEVGHVRNSLPYITENQMIISEYEAELFALDLMKQFYPTLLPQVIKTMKDNLADKAWCAENPIHYQAFEQIKEYQ